ncbi:putative non-symbiotic hemoglobin [Hibiscus syriacus]|uniref:Non-symbiotic hemoglobin n=1 Tax=Hibiscus syriacus TaxID=106335 RepID=A0A6A2ZHX5_HIBSY|nr:plastid division protein PDV2-like [Hibiscus syriacus]KAE8690742.1 putative non-symbiotic hemoglobin [Hibiscus syriacus]
MEEEGVGLALARATELRLKISSCITKATAANPVSPPYEQTPQNQADENGRLNGDKGHDSHQSLSGEDEDEDEETTERLLDIRYALESLESQLLALQNLQHQQSYEKEVALSEIDYSRRVVLEKLEEYQGKDMEVILEASAFFSKTVENNSDLLLPPYPSRPPRSLVPDNGSLSHLQSTYKPLPNGISTGAKQVESENSRKGFGHFISSAVKTFLPLVGVMYILSLSNFVPSIGKGNPVKIFGMSRRRANEEKNSDAPCPPGKVLVMEDGEARCLVKERIEVPFESLVAKPDVNYGCG